MITLVLDFNNFIPRKDTLQVLRLLPNQQSYDEVQAYLEAHLNDPNRVLTVVEELLGMNNLEDQDSNVDSSNDQIPVENDQVELMMKKGKGVGKSSKMPMKDETTEPNENLSSSKRKIPDGKSTSEDKKIKLDEDEEGAASSSEKVAGVEVDPPPGDISDETSPELQDPTEAPLLVCKILPLKAERPPTPSGSGNYTDTKSHPPAQISEDRAAVNLLADNLQAIFPGTPREYIQIRSVDLVGKAAAIDAPPPPH